ncbi:hypothetical protein ENKO_481 [Klebsiella phage fENko-Kae01]|nr:hypothetical protein [Klebsiella phage fENko-Kae01]
MPHFTFAEPTQTSTKKTKVKTDNAAGLIYTAMKKSKVRNPKFKPAFVASLPRQHNYSKTVLVLLNMYKSSGSLKCSCCNSSEAYFVIHVECGRATFRAMVDTNSGRQVLTVDHDVLKSLGGKDEEQNYNPLCYKCNQIRGSRFAGFKEFKEWYDSQEVIDTISGLPSANFCHIDFKSNLNNNIHCETINGATALPPNMMNELKKEMRRDQYDIFSKLSIKIWLKMDRDSANTILNELVLERIQKRHNKKHIKLQNHNFFNYQKNITDHRKIKMHIEEQLRAQVRKLRNTPVHVSTEEVKKVNTAFSFKNIWSALKNIFA